MWIWLVGVGGLITDTFTTQAAQSVLWHSTNLLSTFLRQASTTRKGQALRWQLPKPSTITRALNKAVKKKKEIRLDRIYSDPKEEPFPACIGWERHCYTQERALTLTLTFTAMTSSERPEWFLDCGRRPIQTLRLTCRLLTDPAVTSQS